MLLLEAMLVAIVDLSALVDCCPIWFTQIKKAEMMNRGSEVL